MSSVQSDIRVFLQGLASLWLELPVLFISIITIFLTMALFIFLINFFKH